MSKVDKQDNTPSIFGSAILACGAAIIALILLHINAGNPPIGVDNDDIMRLVQVRDLLAGQSWFDLTQYRLGLEPGTLMHWSRLVDLPIAGLILLFSMFVPVLQAELYASFLWPLLTLIPLFWAMAYGAAYLGGRNGLLIGLVLTFIFVLTSNRFGPGSLDHHNIQLALIIIIMASILPAKVKFKNYAIAGCASAIAIAIGAETTPQIAIICILVSLSWVWVGAKMVRAVQAFALSLAATLTLAYFTTVSPQLYSFVACDGYSSGFYTIGTIGGCILYLTVTIASKFDRLGRFIALGVAAILMVATLLVLVPQCLQSPLADIDPLLRQYWLDQVSEAKSIFSFFKERPSGLFGFYVVPIIAMGVCLYKIKMGKMQREHVFLFIFILASFAISLVQVRGAVFSNLMAILPLSTVVGAARTHMHKHPKNILISLKFIGLSLISTQVIWTLSSALILNDFQNKSLSKAANIQLNEVKKVDVSYSKCITAKNYAQLARLDKGVVSAVSNIGAEILLYTPHRVLSAPYHRNQVGMIAQIKIVMSKPDEALKLLKENGVNYVVTCANDPESVSFKKIAPDGLFANLDKNNIPAYLKRISERKNPVQIFEVITE